MTKIPPGVYSVENGKLQLRDAGAVLWDENAPKNVKQGVYATIGFSLPGVPQLEVRERSAEEVLREYVSFEDVNGNDTVEMLPLTIVDCMEEYRSQPISPVSEEEILKEATIYANKNYEFCSYGDNGERFNDHSKILNAYKTALSRTQSGYTREQMEKCWNAGVKWGDANCELGGETRLPKFDEWMAENTPSITSVTIGEENNIIDIKYKEDDKING